MISAWIFVIVVVTSVIFLQKKHHPNALFILFFTELWERFSYYGMRALLVLYMANELLYSDDKAYSTYGAYGALVYATPVLGGFLADRFLGFRKAIFWGGVLMAIGHFLMSIQNDIMFYAALGFLIIGNGLFKPNISSLIGKFYKEGDPKRDSAFTIFYMGINAGAFLAPLTCGVIGQDPDFGWHYGFGIAGIGMVLGLVIFMWGNLRNQFQDKGNMPGDPNKIYYRGIKIEYLIVIGALFIVPLLALLVNFSDFSSKLLSFVGVSMLGYLFYIAIQEESVQRDRLFVLLSLFVFTVLFWTFFELAGSSINLFTDRNVERKFLDNDLPASMFQSVNPFFIIILGPLFAWIWESLGKRGKDPSAPLKFSFALMLLGVGFAMLVLGAYLAGPDGLSPLMFLILAYLFHTMGELCISPIGLSLVTKLSPARIVAFVMGVWFLSSSFAHLVGAQISRLTSVISDGEKIEEKVSPLITLWVYADVFKYVGLVAIGAGFFLLFLVPILKKWMHGVK